MKAIKHNLRLLWILSAATLIVFVFGCGGGGDGGPVGTAPVIENVFITDENFNLKYQFNIGDAYNFMVTATDPEKNMDEMAVEQYFPSNSTDNPYYGPTIFGLPSQSDNTMTYYLISSGTVTGPSGDWRIEFQISDSTGFESNVFTVYVVIN